MFFKLTSYIKFLLKSTNQHGVHSPFVFSFVTKCLYSKKRWDHRKSINVLLKSIDYFGFGNVKLGQPSSLKQTLHQSFPQLTFTSDKMDLLYMTEFDEKQLHQLLSKQILHNDSMIFIDGIYSNQEKEHLWKNLIQIPHVTVSIDMFYCGALFIRKEQVKEHFTIRI
ncbi:hypothetical protein [Flagellimonas sp. 2504JD4-2]